MAAADGPEAVDGRLPRHPASIAGRAIDILATGPARVLSAGGRLSRPFMELRRPPNG